MLKSVDIDHQLTLVFQRRGGGSELGKRFHEPLLTGRMGDE